MAIRRAGTTTGIERAFVGRDDVLDDLRSAALDARTGSGSVMLLTGEAGIGKTTVVRAFTRDLPDGLDVVWGSASPDRSAPPLWPWRGVVDADAAAGLRDDLGVSAIGSARFELMTALTDELAARAGECPTVVVIEDLHWADVTSVLLLAHVGATIVDLPLLVIGTLRTGEILPAPLEDAIEQVRRTAAVRTVEPLAVPEIGELVRLAGLEPDGRLSAVIRERTGGNALFVTELVRAVRAADATEPAAGIVAGTVPTRVSELVTHRLARLPGPVADIVRLASVVGADGETAALALVSGVGVDVALDRIEQARAANLFAAAPPGRWRFRHDLVRDAVHATMPEAERARRHADVLDALAADPSTPPAVLAHHALAAQPLFDAERAVALAARAGEAALAHHGYEEAVAWFERALEVAPAGSAPRWRAELLVRCGEAHRHVGHVPEAQRAFVEASELTGDAGLLARAALGYADPGADLGIAYRTDDPVTSTLLERAISAQPEGDTQTTVLLEARLAAELYFSDRPDRARELSGAAFARAERLGDRRALGAAGAVVHDAYMVGQAPLDEQLAGSSQLVEWATADGSPAALLTAHRARVFDLLAAGDLVAMDAEILAFRRVAEPLGAPGYLWWLALWAAMRALLEGRQADAEQRAVEALEIGSGPCEGLAFVNFSFLLFFLRREQGRLAEMERAVRDHAASHADIPAIRVALALLLAETGRHDEARGIADAICRHDLARLRDRNWPASWFQMARVASLVDDRDVAAALLDEASRPTERCVQVSLGTVCLGATDLATAWLLHTVGDLDGAERYYESAAALNAAIGARTWLEQTRADLARLRAERRSPTPSPESAGVTTGVFRRSGAGWEVEFAGRRAHVADARGMVDIATLLARPGEAVAAIDLLGVAASTSARGAEAFDGRARREIRERLRELDAAIDDAEARGDGERAALVREQRRELAEAVARDLGLGGRSRRVGDPVERARKTVSTRIRRTVAAVGEAHPPLGRHLERSIDTGSWCAYRPEDPVEWRT